MRTSVHVMIFFGTHVDLLQLIYYPFYCSTKWAPILFLLNSAEDQICQSKYVYLRWKAFFTSVALLGIKTLVIRANSFLQDIIRIC